MLIDIVRLYGNFSVKKRTQGVQSYLLGKLMDEICTYYKTLSLIESFNA